jgi:hypothetical protein
LSPAANSLSWRRGALASAITSHAGDLILRTLADHATELGIGSPIQGQLADAADAISQVWPAWRAIARHWDTITTGTHHARDISPIAAELEDLPLRTGRLAYDNPRWTPACTDASPPRDPAALGGDLTDVLAAVHHAIDAISTIATCDTDTVRAAADGHGLYLPTRLLPDKYDIPCLYAPLPPQLARELLRTYDTATAVSRTAAIAIDDLAVTIDSPSSTLAVGRIPSGGPATKRQPTNNDGTQAQAPSAPPPRVPLTGAGRIEDILRSLHITEPGMLLRAAAIDEAASDMLAKATTSSRIRDSLNRQPSKATRQIPSGAAKTAAKDLQNARALADQHATPGASLAGGTNSRLSTRTPRTSPMRRS